ncbi:hypothetical protein [Actinoallomurus iriomotensis]|uniref:hypothetical protein n=1 Tax=Actinoallomurus iriomotensis TaxID=478107 RepID=UPI002557BDD3|nr:hypothetical protein [Actinoallomurus iriomotensis]
MSARRKSGNRLLPKEVRERLQAVVVDANAYGQVGPDLSSLAELAKELSTIGIQVWVPEPVAWEWADHLANQWAVARAAVREAAPLHKAGLLPVLHFEDHYKHRDAVVDAFLDRLKAIPYVEVVSLSGESALEGLRDQVLQRPPAKKKSEVKTGGSDSAWLRTVLAKVGGAADALLFLSSDGDIKRAYEAWGHPPPLLCSVRDIRGSLFEYLPASVEDEWLIAESLVGRMPIDLRASTSEIDRAIIDSVVGLTAALRYHPDDEGITAAHLTRLTALAGLSRVKRKRADLDHEDPSGPDTRIFVADVFFLAEADAVRTVQNSLSGEVTTTGTQSGAGLLVRAAMTLTIRDKAIETMRSDGEAVVFATHRRFSDSDEAWYEVAQALSAVPGLRMPDEWGEYAGEGDQQIRVAGRDQTLELHWSRSEWGALSVRIDGEEATVSCEYDGTAWWGGKDGMDMEPPYYLFAEVPMDYALNSEWELPAWIITQLIKHRDQPDA